ncbi:hypothetical protein LQK93_01768 [Terrabacter sp. BE26]
MTLAQFRVLVLLTSQGRTTLVQLAARLGVNASTAQRQVDRLVRDELVDRRENPEDRRQVLLVATEPGARLVEAVTERRRAEIARIVRALPGDHRTALVAAIEAFTAAANEPTAGRDPAHPLGWRNPAPVPAVDTPIGRNLVENSSSLSRNHPEKV